MGSRGESDVDKGWSWLVLVAVYSIILIISTSLFTSGVIYVALLENYNEDAAKTSLIGALNSGLLCLLGPFASVVMDMYSCRMCMLVGAIMATLSYVTAAFVDSVDLLIIIVGLLGGIGNAMASTPLTVVLAYYFEKRRTFFIALSRAIVGFSIFIASPLSLMFLNTYGLKGTFILNGGLYAHVIVCALICKPSVKELLLKDEKRTKCFNRNGGEKERTTSRILYKIKDTSKTFLRLDLVTKIPFVAFLFSTVTWNFMISVCLMHLPNYIHVLSENNNEFDTSVKITVVMTVFAVANTLGRFLGAFSVNQSYINSITIHVLALFFGGALTMSFPLYSSFSGAGFAFAALAGVFIGIPNSLITPITLRLVGLDQLSGAHGLETFFSGIGYTSGAPVASLLFESTRKYEDSFMLSGAVLLAGSVLSIVPYCYVRKHGRKYEKNGSVAETPGEQNVPMIDS